MRRQSAECDSRTSGEGGLNSGAADLTFYYLNLMNASIFFDRSSKGWLFNSISLSRERAYLIDSKISDEMRNNIHQENLLHLIFNQEKISRPINKTCAKK